MIRIWAAALVLLSLSPAIAQDLPAFFDVAGVSQNDVLNVRSEPTAGSDIVGKLAAGQTGVEVVAVDDSGRWGQVNVGERSGWASMTYLVRQTPDGYGPARQLSCFGTEPFWSLDLIQNQGGEFRDMAETTLHFPLGRLSDSGNLIGRYGTIAQTDDGTLAIIVRREACNDGMSDRQFGLGIDLVLGGPGASQTLPGCCRIGQN